MIWNNGSSANLPPDWFPSTAVWPAPRWGVFAKETHSRLGWEARIGILLTFFLLAEVNLDFLKKYISFGDALKPPYSLVKRVALLVAAGHNVVSRRSCKRPLRGHVLPSLVPRCNYPFFRLFVYFFLEYNTCRFAMFYYPSDPTGIHLTMNKLDKSKILSSPCANYRLWSVAWRLLWSNIKSRKIQFLWSRILKYLQFDCCHSPVLLIQQYFRKR